MIDNRVIAILMDLFATGQMSLYELSIRTGMDKEDVLNSLQQVNALLKIHSLPQIELVEGRYYIVQELLEKSNVVFELFHQQQVSLSQEERIIILYLYTFIRKEFISNNHYQDLLNVSRNTTLSDIKQAKALCADFSLSLEYTRARGYHLLGKEEDKYRLALYTISACVKSTMGYWALNYVLRSWGEENRIKDLHHLGQELCHFYHYSSLEVRLEEYLYFLQFLRIRKQRVTSSVHWDRREIPPAIVEMAEQFCLKAGFSQECYQDCVGYVAPLLQGCLEGVEIDSTSIFRKLTEEIVDEMERLSVIRFSNRKELVAGLQRHLVPAYYRLKSQLVTVNSYTEVIKTEHEDLFKLVKKALKPFEDYLGFPISDSEVSYFVVHFGGYIEASKEERASYRAAVICPNGISSSLIVKEQLSQIFPMIYFSDTSALKHRENLDESAYDMVFSTVPIQGLRKPFFLVSQLMTEVQKRELFHLVSEEFPTILYVAVEIEQLLSLIGEHATIHHPSALKYELVQFLNTKLYDRKEESPMLDELITKETYVYSKDQLTWREAIGQAARPLVDNGCIEETYIEAMISKVEEFGPFIDLGKGVAIPHARPEEGVNQIGMSMLNLENPVYLADDPSHEIRLMICIAAIDNQTHLKALSHLTTLLREEDSLQTLIKAKSFEDIQHLIKEEK